MSTVRPVTKRNAERVRKIIIDHFPAFTRDVNGDVVAEKDLPVLRAPNTGWGEHWTLAWEGGTPYEWPVLASLGGREEYARVKYEPVLFGAGCVGWRRGCVSVRAR